MDASTQPTAGHAGYNKLSVINQPNSKRPQNFGFSLADE